MINEGPLRNFRILLSQRHSTAVERATRVPQKSIPSPRRPSQWSANVTASTVFHHISTCSKESQPRGLLILVPIPRSCIPSQSSNQCRFLHSGSHQVGQRSNKLIEVPNRCAKNKRRRTNQDEGGSVGPWGNGREDGRKEERDEEEERHAERGQAGPAPLPDTSGRLHEGGHGGGAQTRAHNDGGRIRHEGGVLAREVALLVNCKGGSGAGCIRAEVLRYSTGLVGQHDAITGRRGVPAEGAALRVSAWGR
jgi:hypothetical protein